MKDIEAISGQYRARSCEWTTSNDKVGFFYPTCGKDVVPEKAYCEEHLAQAYRPSKRRRK